MTTARRIELTAAAACATLGVLGAVYALFGPTVRTETATEYGIGASDGSYVPTERTSSSESLSLIEDGVEPAAIVYFAVMLGLATTVPVLAFAHGRWHAARRSTPLWLTAGLLAFMALLAGFSVGLFLLPAALAAIVTAVAASKYRPPSRAISSP